MIHFHRWERGEMWGETIRACSKCLKVQKLLGSNGGTPGDDCWVPLSALEQITFPSRAEFLNSKGEPT